MMPKPMIVQHRVRPLGIRQYVSGWSRPIGGYLPGLLGAARVTVPLDRDAEAV
jgi:hypothetical protein